MKLLFLQNMFDKVYNLVTVFINYSTVRNYSIANMPKPIIQLNMIKDYQGFKSKFTSKYKQSLNDFEQTCAYQQNE